MGRRGNNEGSIYRRQDGRWTASVSVEGGQRKYYYGRTRQEVSRKLTVALRARQEGLPLTSDRQTVSQYLEHWLESVNPSLRPRTWTRYEELLRLHAVPEIGHLSLAKLSPQHVQRLYAGRLEQGLSPTTVRHLHTTLHTALSQAAKWGIVARNVISLVSPPRSTHREMAVLSPEETRALLGTAAGDGLEALFVLALSTGMRQGELLGLRWKGVDLEAGRLHVTTSLQWTRDGPVFAEPKTARSRRQITLTQAAVDALRHHRVEQAQERLQLGASWEDNDLVFSNYIGRPVSPWILIRHFHELLAKADLPKIRFHDLRHTAATLLLGQGVHPKIVSEMLGHSNIATTLDLYSHVTPVMQRQAAEVMDAVLSGS